MVKISFEIKIGDEIMGGSFITDDKNGNIFMNSKNKDKLIRDVISMDLEVIGYDCKKI